MKNLKKILGLVLVAILLTTSVGTSTAQAISWKEWPYGKYKGVPTTDWDEYATNNRLVWQYLSDTSNAYDEYVYTYVKGSTLKTKILLKRTKTKNKYKSKIYKNENGPSGNYTGKYYAIIKLKGKYAYLYWYDQMKNGKYKKQDVIYKYKRYKAMSKNVG